MNKIIEINNLKKTYPDGTAAVKGISFYVEEGKFYSFLGQNGAGKSTTINMISTLLSITSGDVMINGYKLDKQNEKIRESIGVVFQQSMLDDTLTVRENIELKANMYRYSKDEVKRRVNAVIKDLKLTDYENKHYKNLSGGQKRRADIARALVNTPKILILDEPTTGLDPHTRQLVWNEIRAVQVKYNMTVLLTTHYLDETIDSDYVIIIDKGVITATGTPEDLRYKYSKDRLKILPNELKELEEVLKKDGISYKADRDLLIIDIDKTRDAIPLINKYDKYIKSFEVIAGSMDDVFIELSSNSGGVGNV